MITLAQAHKLPDWHFAGEAFQKPTMIEIRLPEQLQKIFVDEGMRAPGIQGTLHFGTRNFTLEKRRRGTWEVYEQPQGIHASLGEPVLTLIVTTDDDLVFHPLSTQTIRVDALDENRPIGAVALTVAAYLQSLS